MKRFHFSRLFLLLLLVMPMMIKAQQISESEAQNKALSFFANQANKGVTIKKAPSRSSDNQVTLAYTAKKNNTNYFYVYNRGNDEGYVIVGGDEQAKEILAYVPHGHFVYDSIPDNVKWWLGQYEHEIDSAIMMASYMSVPARKTMRLTIPNTMHDIPDLITTKWNQGEPYNIAIPLVGDDSIHCVTGCVPTALAQIMNYWEYPTHGIGSKSYSIDYTDIGQTVTFSADFANTTYDWTHMRDSYTEGQYTEQDAQAVAVLMYHVGVALEVGYGKYSTGYGSPGESTLDQEYRGIRHDLPEYFGYDEGMEGLFRENFTLEQWKTLLYSELTLGRPVYYSGADLSAGHAFVCHGYSSSLDMFSFNWGWGGQDDGYYALSGTNAVNGYTLRTEYIIIGIRPAGYNTSSTHLCYGDKFLYNDVWYKVYDEQNRQVEVTHPEWVDAWRHPDDIDFTYCQGAVTIPPVVEYNGIEYTVSRIGSYAFIVADNGQTNINSISLPSSITSLGAGAFFSCQSLIDSIILPDAIEVIPQRCFEQCNRSPYISIPSSLKNIGFAGFYGCRLLEQITLPEGCYKISPFAFCGCSRLAIVNIPSTMQIFASACFEGTSLIKMTFSCESFVSAESYVEGDYMTTNINPFPNSIEKGILYVPSALVETYRNTTDKFWSKWGTIASLDSVNPYIGKRFIIDEFEYQIYNDSCVQLTAVDHVDYTKNTMIVPSKVSYEGSDYDVAAIASGAFIYDGFGLKGIEKLVLSEGIKIIGENTFEGCGFREIVLPNSIEKIGQGAFNICHELESLDIPGSVKIAQGVMQCGSLKQIIIHEGTTCLGPNFLAQCPKLEHVFFPSSVWYSAGGTITDCASLRSIVSLTDSLSVAPFKCDWSSEDAYNKMGELIDTWADGYGSNHDSVKLYIPDSLLHDPSSDYNNNYPWNDFPNKLSYVPMTSFDIPDSMFVVQHEQFVIPAQFLPADASYQMLKWTSSDESIVSVSCEGVALAHSAGQAVITASAIDGCIMSRSCVINVQEMSIPTDSASFYTYLPSVVFTSNPAIHYDTIVIPVISDGGDMFVAFELSRNTRVNDLYFDMADHTFEIFSPSLRGDINMVLRFRNVEPVDTLWIRWRNEAGYITSEVQVKNVRVWNKYSMRYPVQFVNDDAQVLQDSLYKYGSMPVYEGPLPTKAEDEQYTYTFAGWTPEVALVTQAATYTATYTSSLREYPVTFLNEDSTVISSKNYKYGETPVAPADPVKQNTAEYTYTFNGWDNAIAQVQGPQTYKATFTASKNSYTITWQDENGSQIDQTTVEYGQIPAHADPVKLNTAEYTYTFAGWTPEVVAVTGDATYKATFTATKNSYTITWLNEDGLLIDQTTVEYGVVPTHVGPTKEATAEYTYTFAGWTPSVTAVTGEATYKATFSATKNSYTITWQNEDGSLIDQTIVEYGVIPTHAEPTKEATAEYTYTFAGWTPEVVAVTGDATYKATFNSTKNKYLIVFQDEDGTELKSEQVEYGEMPIAPAAPSKEPTSEYIYTFAGWMPEIVVVTKDATYTATYDATPVSEGFEDISAEGSAPQKVMIDGQIFILRGDKIYTLQGQEVK